MTTSHAFASGAGSVGHRRPSGVGQLRITTGFVAIATGTLLWLIAQSRAWYTTSVFGFNPGASYSLVRDYVNSHDGARVAMVARLYLANANVVWWAFVGVGVAFLFRRGTALLHGVLTAIVVAVHVYSVEQLRATVVRTSPFGNAATISSGPGAVLAMVAIVLAGLGFVIAPRFTRDVVRER